MDKIELLKAPKNSDKLRLIKQEEEAFEHNKYETTSCGRRCKVLLFYGVLIGMLIILYYTILLGWQSYMRQFSSNETTPVFAIYGIPMLHIDEKPDKNEEIPGATTNTYENINKRKRRSPQTVIGIQSHNDNLDKDKANHLNEENSIDKSITYVDSLHEDSSKLEKLLEQIIASEKMPSNTEQNSYSSNLRVEQIINHQISEDKDKEFIHYNVFNQNSDDNITNTESSVSDNNNYADIFHYKTADRKYMQNIYHLTEEHENVTLGEIYYGILIVFGILLIISFCLCIKVFYEIISVKIMNKHKRLQEEQTDEINKRLDPIKCQFPKTPVEKDLRFTVNREKMDMFCDLYD